MQLFSLDTFSQSISFNACHSEMYIKIFKFDSSHIFQWSRMDFSFFQMDLAMKGFFIFQMDCFLVLQRVNYPKRFNDFGTTLFAVLVIGFNFYDLRNQVSNSVFQILLLLIISQVKYHHLFVLFELSDFIFALLRGLFLLKVLKILYICYG